MHARVGHGIGIVVDGKPVDHGLEHTVKVFQFQCGFGIDVAHTYAHVVRALGQDGRRSRSARRNRACAWQPARCLVPECGVAD